jgi:hypothetical protein
VSFGWRGHEGTSPNHPNPEQLRQSPDQLPEALNMKNVALRMGFSALILAVAVLNQQIAVAVISALERLSRSAEIQGTITKPLGPLVADIFQ